MRNKRRILTISAPLGALLELTLDIAPKVVTAEYFYVPQYLAGLDLGLPAALLEHNRIIQCGFIKQLSASFDEKCLSLPFLAFPFW